ncbi:hypothetical protein FRC12_005526 [Ceratobasidium sp. 428]|nr:hypothetical protein FRC12_005526 [Ceratobasidium sp. 428]
MRSAEELQKALETTRKARKLAEVIDATDRRLNMTCRLRKNIGRVMAGTLTRNPNPPPSPAPSDLLIQVYVQSTKTSFGPLFESRSQSRSRSKFLVLGRVIVLHLNSPALPPTPGSCRKQSPLASRSGSSAYSWTTREIRTRFLATQKQMLGYSENSSAGTMRLPNRPCSVTRELISMGDGRDVDGADDGRDKNVEPDEDGGMTGMGAWAVVLVGSFWLTWDGTATGGGGSMGACSFSFKSSLLPFPSVLFLAYYYTLCSLRHLCHLRSFHCLCRLSILRLDRPL